MNKHDSVYVSLHYDEISLTFTAGYVCLCGVCSPWTVCEVGVVLYVVDAVVAVTVIHVLLFVLHVCMLRECECARVTAMLVWRQEEVWLRCVRIWVVHVDQVFCLVQVTC